MLAQGEPAMVGTHVMGFALLLRLRCFLFLHSHTSQSIHNSPCCSLYTNARTLVPVNSNIMVSSFYYFLSFLFCVLCKMNKKEEFCNSDNLPCIEFQCAVRLTVDSSTLDLTLLQYSLASMVYSFECTTDEPRLCSLPLIPRPCDCVFLQNRINLSKLLLREQLWPLHILDHFVDSSASGDGNDSGHARLVTQTPNPGQSNLT